MGSTNDERIYALIDLSFETYAVAKISKTLQPRMTCHHRLSRTFCECLSPASDNYKAHCYMLSAMRMALCF